MLLSLFLTFVMIISPEFIGQRGEIQQAFFTGGRSVVLTDFPSMAGKYARYGVKFRQRDNLLKLLELQGEITLELKEGGLIKAKCSGGQTFAGNDKLSFNLKKESDCYFTIKPSRNARTYHLTFSNK